LRTARPDDLRDFDGSELRSRFTGRLMMRRALSSVHHRAAAQTAFRGLRTAPGRAAARHILFGDRSFPDTPSAAPTAGSATAGTGPLHR
ncbi:MAG: hypothetical protein WA892_05715, partial [Ornithinimicrobium sp.]